MTVAVMDNLCWRKATLDDAETLLAWRNDPVTRMASLNGDVIEPASHIAWFETVIRSPDRHQYIFELNGTPVGAVRADKEPDGHRLSWMVAPQARGQGIGKRMVAQVVRLIDGPVRAEIKADNQASVNIAEYAGLVLEAQDKSILVYIRA